MHKTSAPSPKIYFVNMQIHHVDMQLICADKRVFDDMQYN